ncbi:single-minded homolog 1-like [Clavelina lepadiformis]|uniref:Uncharacterized protein n=1 Tax=Clavelina lepadiformis TaxID=159417 RepID=A0ABP0GQE6_CLALP
MLQESTNSEETCSNDLKSTGAFNHTEENNSSEKEQHLRNLRMSHMKKEKSRDAARSRRGKENFEFYELAKLLPVPNDTSSQLDKASIIRLTMSYLQLRDFFHTSNFFLKSYSVTAGESDMERFVQQNLSSVLLQSLDGFLMVINKKGRCLYVSNTVSSYLGLAQVDMVGSCLSNFIHPADQLELTDHLEDKCCENGKGKFCRITKETGDKNTCSCSFYIRMKSTLTRRGMSIKSSGYKVVHISGCLSHKNLQCISNNDDDSSNEDSEECTIRNNLLGFVAIAQVLPSPSVTDLQLEESMFVARLGPSLRINYCEERVKQVTDYEADEVKGCTIYHFVHTADLDKIRMCHLEILTKGQVTTPYYRWLTKSGSYVWLQSCVTLLIDKHQNTEEDAFVWITHVVSERGNGWSQIKASKDKTSSPTADQASDNDSTKSSLKPGVKACRSYSSSEPEAIDNNSAVSVKSDETKESNVKFVKELPDKCSALKRTHSTNTYNALSEPVDKEHIVKRERMEERLPESSAASEDGKSSLSKTEDVLDVDSTMWRNPPNREVSNRSDLNTTVIHHHYPYGIDPNVLNSNPLFAKMLTTSYVSYDSLLSSRDAYILAPPVNYLAPMLNPLPQVVSAPPKDIAGCPSSVATIVDELRKDPMRKVSPPNKVILSSSQIPYSKLVMPAFVEVNNGVAGAASSTQNNQQNLNVNRLHPSVLTLSDVPNSGILLAPLPGCTPHGTNGPLILQPFKLAHNVNALNSLPI